MRSNPMDGPESKVSQNYIETLLEMPWEERTKEHISIRAAREELDKDHYGLEKVKEQVLEFLAVRQLQMNAQEADKEQGKNTAAKRRSYSLPCRTAWNWKNINCPFHCFCIKS